MISSKNNELIKFCNQIKQKKHSKQSGFCFVESLKVVNDLSKKGLITTILSVESKFDQIKKLGVKVEIISNDIVEYLADSITSDGVFGICKIAETQNIEYKKCLVLDRIQDPANLGAIVRSACAFGYNTIFTIDSVYPYSFKAIRSSMGYVFSVNFIDVDYEQLVDLKKKYNLDFYVADMNGSNIEYVQKPTNNFAIVIGNEGQGVDSRLFEISDNTVSICMQNNVESLNASVSAGIIMYILK